MVDIDFIRTTSCPICGCKTIVSESVETDCIRKGEVRRHCNGGKWEHRIFACGYHVYFCPNYGREEILGKCAFDPEEAARAEKRKALKMSLLEHIEHGDCQDDYKERLLRAIEYI